MSAEERKKVEARLQELRQAHQQALAQAMRLEGAIMLAEEWLNAAAPTQEDVDGKQQQISA